VPPAEAVVQRCRTASGEEQGGSPSLTAARSANGQPLSRKSSGDWTRGLRWYTLLADAELEKAALKDLLGRKW